MAWAARFFAGLYRDGFGFIGLLAPVASIATTLCKWAGVTVGGLDELSWAWAFAPISVWLLVAYVRRWNAYREHVESPRPDALGLSQMPVTAIAEYLLNESRWGWQTYARLNRKNFVKDHVPAEMSRAGATHEVRYIGTLPNTFNAAEIDRTYWRHAHIDDLRIWDEGNFFFTRTINMPGVKSYQYGTAPRVDVRRTWPRASFIQKIWTVIFVRLKGLYWAVEGFTERGMKWVLGKISALKKLVNKAD